MGQMRSAQKPATYSPISVGYVPRSKWCQSALGIDVVCCLSRRFSGRMTAPVFKESSLRVSFVSAGKHKSAVPSAMAILIMLIIS